MAPGMAFPAYAPRDTADSAFFMCIIVIISIIGSAHELLKIQLYVNHTDVGSLLCILFQMIGGYLEPIPQYEGMPKSVVWTL